jgi:poly(3-hydroxybutyrate) depolymerase
MTMMGGPIDARKSPTAVNDLATQRSIEWFENNVIFRVPSSFPGAGRKVYPGFLQHTGFVAMNPDHHLGSHYDYFQDLVKGDKESSEAHRKFYDEYNAVLDMDANYYLQTIQTVFREFKLVNGTWDVVSPDGKVERVRPQDIRTTALMTVEGELDDISGSGQTAAAHDLCTGIPKAQRKHYEAQGAGHYGIFSGRRWRENVYPEVKAFISAHALGTSPAKGLAPTKPANGAAPAKRTSAAAKPAGAKAAATTAVTAVAKTLPAKPKAGAAARKQPAKQALPPASTPRKQAATPAVPAAQTGDKPAAA